MSIEAGYPQWWIMRSCKHWTADKNRRFRLVRLDGPTDYCGTYPAHGFDGELKVIEPLPYGVKGGDLLRRASVGEVPKPEQLDMFGRTPGVRPGISAPGHIQRMVRS